VNCFDMLHKICLERPKYGTCKIENQTQRLDHKSNKEFQKLEQYTEQFSNNCLN